MVEQREHTENLTMQFSLSSVALLVRKTYEKHGKKSLSKSLYDLLIFYNAALFFLCGFIMYAATPGILADNGSRRTRWNDRDVCEMFAYKAAHEYISHFSFAKRNI